MQARTRASREFTTSPPQPPPRELAPPPASRQRLLHRAAHAVSASLVGLGLSAGAWAAGQGPVIQGKDDWLFVSYEMPAPELAPDAQTSLALIGKLNRVLAHNQITLVVVVVPSKIETYAEYLPDGFQVPGYTANFYSKAQTTLRQSGVRNIDLKTPFRTDPLRTSETPLFFRLDTHWTPTGALLAAHTVHTGLRAEPAGLKALNDSPPAGYALTWAAAKERETNFKDIARLLPAGSREPRPDEVLRFKVAPAGGAAASSLLGPAMGGDIALVGSSLSGDWTGFPDALRFALQRNLVNFSINADVGPWFAMRSYLSDDAFQTATPKLVLWEIPERVLGLPPSFKQRQAQFRMDDREWLRQVAALAQNTCEQAPVNLQLEATGLMDGRRQQGSAATTEGDFLEISFDRPVSQDSYFSARLTSAGSKRVTLEASGPGVATHKFSIEVASDGNAHALKTPLSVDGKTYNRLKIYPGNTTDFALANVDVCRYPEDLLK